MTSFLKDVIADLQEKDVDFSKLIFILPSKRAGVFLMHHLSKSLHKTIFSPEILSIEEFVESISDINYSSNTELLFEFYNVYLDCTSKNEAEPFETFIGWAQLLLQDFNEIDRYLIEPNTIFDYLKAIKVINHWSLADEQTESVKNYITFWNRLKIYYQQFKEQLLVKKKAIKVWFIEKRLIVLSTISLHLLESNIFSLDSTL